LPGIRFFTGRSRERPALNDMPGGEAKNDMPGRRLGMTWRKRRLGMTWRGVGNAKAGYVILNEAERNEESYIRRYAMYD